MEFSYSEQFTNDTYKQKSQIIPKAQQKKEKTNGFFKLRSKKLRKSTFKKKRQ